MNILPILNAPTEEDAVLDHMHTAASSRTNVPTIILKAGTDLDDYVRTREKYTEKTIILHPSGHATFVHPQSSTRSSTTVMSIHPKSPLYKAIRDSMRTHLPRLDNLINWRDS